MILELRKLDKRDYNKAIAFAIEGMHFRWYADWEFIVKLYGRYFWYLEMTRATQVLAAYFGDAFAGVQKKYVSFWKSLYVKFFDFLQNTFAKDGVGVYDEANREMFRSYCENNQPDGEIIFLAANPKVKVKGIGSFLLEELARREKGKKVFFTFGLNSSAGLDIGDLSKVLRCCPRKRHRHLYHL